VSKESLLMATVLTPFVSNLQAYQRRSLLQLQSLVQIEKTTINSGTTSAQQAAARTGRVGKRIVEI